MPRHDFSLPRLHVAADLAPGASVALDPAQAHYLVTVLRLKAGAGVLLFNGRDGEWAATVAETGRRAVALAVGTRTRAQTEPGDLHYLFAPLKRARLDYLAQKATEMGVSALRPVITARTVAERVNVERLRANTVEAAEQCGILSLPEVHAPQRLADIVAGWPPGRRLVLCDEDAPVADPLAALAPLGRGPLAVMVGPEGGFTEAERALLRGRPFVTVISLGPRILRADTAAVAALALVQAVLGDMS